MRIGQLTRKAYQCGLHQIDNHEQRPLFDCIPASDEEAEEWRYVWWFIYCLDSYCNITAATPFVVKVDSVKTALVKTSLPNPADSRLDSTTTKFLPSGNRPSAYVLSFLGKLSSTPSAPRNTLQGTS